MTDGLPLQPQSLHDFPPPVTDSMEPESARCPNPLSSRKPARGRRGVVAVILREDRFLVIRRSRWVTAPGKLCFPGGGIEPGETEQQALVREMREEIALDVQPLHRLWRSETPWGTQLAWWLAEAPAGIDPTPAPSEVEAIYWMNQYQLAEAVDLLPSLPQFVEAWRVGLLTLPLAHRSLVD